MKKVLSVLIALTMVFSLTLGNGLQVFASSTDSVNITNFSATGWNIADLPNYHSSSILQMVDLGGAIISANPYDGNIGQLTFKFTGDGGAPISGFSISVNGRNLDALGSGNTVFKAEYSLDDETYKAAAETLYPLNASGVQTTDCTAAMNGESGNIIYVRILLRGESVDWVYLSQLTIDTVSSTPVTGVSISPSTATVTVGSTKTLIANVSPSTASDKTVNWTSSDDTIVSVSDSGVVTAVAVGSATITATTVDGSFTSTSAVKVTSTDTANVNISNFSANGWSITNLSNYESNSSNVALMDIAGARIATNNSSVGNITFRLSGHNDANIKGLSITVKGRNLDVFSSGTYIKAEYSLDNVTYKTAATSLLSNTGEVGAVQTTDCTAAMNGDKANTIYVRILLKGDNADWVYINQLSINTVVDSNVGVTVNPSSATIKTGTTKTLTAAVTPTDLSNKAVVWSSSDESIATVSATGVVTAVAVGTAVITATTVVDGITATCLVKSTSVDTNSVIATNLAPFGYSLANIPNYESKTSNIGMIDLGGARITTSDATVGSVTFKLSASNDALLTGMSIFVKGRNLDAYNSGTFIKAEYSLDNVTYNTAAASLLTSGTVGAEQTTNCTAAMNGDQANTIYVRISIKSDNGDWTYLTQLSIITTSSVNVPVTGVSVSPSTALLGVGSTRSLTATITPSDATNSNITWTSSDDNIATVSASGVVSVVGAGTATITATSADGGFTGTCVVTGSATPLSIFLSRAPINDGSQIWELRGVPGNGSWFYIKHVASDLYLSGVGGQPYLAAYTGGGEQYWSADKLGINSSLVQMFSQTVGISASNGMLSTSATFPALTFSNALTNFSQLNETTFAVNPAGSVIFNGTIKLNEGAKSYYLSYGVEPAYVAVTGITLNKASTSIKVRQSETLSVMFEPSNVSIPVVTWSSSNDSIATVSASGVVTGVAVGNVTITATSEDGGFISSCAVTITAPEQLAPKVIFDASAVTAPYGSGGYEIVATPVNDMLRLRNTGTDTWAYGMLSDYNASVMGTKMWSDYSGMAIRVKNPSANDIWFGISLLTGDRIRITDKNARLINIDGSVNNSTVSYHTIVGSDDPRFTIPANFDGYVMVDFSDMLHGSTSNIDAIASGQIAYFLYDSTGKDENGFLVGDLSLYCGTNYSSVATSLSLKLSTLTDGTNIIANIKLGSTVKTVMEGFAADNTTVSATTASLQPLDGTETVGTGMIITVNNGTTVVTYKTVIYGDLDGNGEISLSDLVKIRDYLLEGTMSTISQAAGDLYAENSVTLNGLVGMMAYLNESGKINQNR